MLEWPLVGRSEELAFVDSVLRRRDAASGVVLAGGAGVGKTRLAREAVALERRRGARVRWVTATECARGVPLGVFADLPPDLGDPRTTVHRAVERIVGGRRGVVVAVDDAHLLDDMSALVVNQLVLQRLATVVATVRTGEEAPDAITAIWKDEHLRRVEVQPLSERETSVLVESALGGPVARATARRLWRMSRGNLLFLRQLVDSGSLVCDGGVWHLVGGVLEVPAVLADMVDARTRALPDDVRAVVDLLALSEPLPVDLLDAETEHGSVERAEIAGVVSIETSTERRDARLAHPLIGEVRRAGMGLLRAQRLRGEIATALASSRCRQQDTSVRRAMLLIDSDLAADAELFVQVGERALALADFRLADRLGRAAVGVGGGFRAQAVVAYAAMWSGRPELADDELGILAALAADDYQFVKATLTRATNLAILMGRPDEARLLLVEGVDRVVEPRLRNTLRALGAMIDSATDRLDAAHEVACEVIDAPNSFDEAVLFASCALVVWAATRGSQELSTHAARGMAACDAVPEFGNFRVPLLTQHVNGLIWAGRLESARATAVEFCRSVGDSPLAGGAYLTGITELAFGRLDSARTSLREARAGTPEMGRASGLVYGVLISLTQCLAALGDLDGAREAQALMSRSVTPGSSFVRPLARLADAWVSAAEGNISAAITLAHEAAAMAAQRGQDMHTVLCLHTAARFGDRTVIAELRELATRVDGPRAAAAVAHAQALAVDDAAALAAAAAAFEHMGDLLSAADATAQAADSYLRHGCRASGNIAAARALRVADHCGGAHSPALSLVESPLPLSTREREVVTLAAAGLTNREIAQRLTVSQRTVDGHVYRASAKLGVASRHDFAAVLGLDGEHRSTGAVSTGRPRRTAR